jgi:acetyltransferase-like isoleucine patch superfamily enzyme
MKALNEIGVGKASRYGILTAAMTLYRLIIFPQIRVVYLRLLGARIGKNTIIHSVRFFNYYRLGFKGLQIGDNCFIGEEATIDLADEVILESDVTIAERVLILTHTNVGYKDHPLQRHYPSMSGSVRIKTGSFVGANTTILPGVTIEPMTFVGAMSLVNKDHPGRSVIAGIPATVIKSLK